MVYMRDQNELSDFETLGSGTVLNNYTCDYDGFIYINRGTGHAWDGKLTRNGVNISIKQYIVNGGNASACIAVRKNDVIQISGSSSSDGSITGSFYKLRDYSNR